MTTPAAERNQGPGTGSMLVPFLAQLPPSSHCPLHTTHHWSLMCLHNVVLSKLGISGRTWYDCFELGFFPVAGLSWTNQVAMWTNRQSHPMVRMDSMPCLTIHSLRVMWVVCSCWILQKMLPWMFMYRCLCEYVFISLGVNVCEYLCWSTGKVQF